MRVEEDRVAVGRTVDPADFPDTDGDGQRVAVILDFGPGDAVRIPRSSFVRAAAEEKTGKEERG